MTGIGKIEVRYTNYPLPLEENYNTTMTVQHKYLLYTPADGSPARVLTSEASERTGNNETLFDFISAKYTDNSPFGYIKVHDKLLDGSGYEI